MNGAVERVVLDLEGKLDVEASLFPKFKELRLPVVYEPKPNMRGTSQPTAEWGTDVPALSQPDVDSGEMQSELDDAMTDMQKQIIKMKQDLIDLDSFENDIEDQLREISVTPDERSKLQREKQEIEKSRQAKQKRISEIENKLENLKTKKAELEQAVNQPIPTQSDNLSIRRHRGRRLKLGLDRRTGNAR